MASPDCELERRSLRALVCSRRTLFCSGSRFDSNCDAQSSVLDIKDSPSGQRTRIAYNTDWSVILVKSDNSLMGSYIKLSSKDGNQSKLLILNSWSEKSQK